jgi:hypothetical protein
MDVDKPEKSTTTASGDSKATKRFEVKKVGPRHMPGRQKGVRHSS